MSYGIQIWNSLGVPTVTLDHETRAFVASGEINIAAGVTHTEVIPGFNASDPTLLLMGPHGIGFTKTNTSTGFTITALSDPVKAYYWVLKG